MRESEIGGTELLNKTDFKIFLLKITILRKTNLSSTLIFIILCYQSFKKDLLIIEAFSAIITFEKSVETNLNIWVYIESATF